MPVREPRNLVEVTGLFLDADVVERVKAKAAADRSDPGLTVENLLRSALGMGVDHRKKRAVVGIRASKDVELGEICQALQLNHAETLGQLNRMGHPVCSWAMRRSTSPVMPILIR